MAPTPLTLVAVITASAINVPHFPVLSHDPAVIGVVDYLRVGILIGGLAMAGLTVRHAVVAPRNLPVDALVPGFQRRCLALCVGLVYVSTAAYDRIGDPVTIQFVMALLFVLASMLTVYDFGPREATPGAARLQEFTPPGELARQQAQQPRSAPQPAPQPARRLAQSSQRHVVPTERPSTP